MLPEVDELLDVLQHAFIHDDRSQSQVCWRTCLKTKEKKSATKRESNSGGHLFRERESVKYVRRHYWISFHKVTTFHSGPIKKKLRMTP